MKVADNIYFDERCTKHPYSVNIMREGYKLAKKFVTQEDAEEARDEFIRKHTLQPTDDPDIFVKQGVHILEFTVYKEYEDFESAKEKADILRKFMKM